MLISVEQIVNKPADSNCYVIYIKGKSNCIIIDPGTRDCEHLFRFLTDKGLNPEFIILTHEHFDHIWGVDKIRKYFESKLICSFACNTKIGNKKKNMSVFYDQIGFEINSADIIIDTLSGPLLWNGKQIEFINTFGHTNSSISIIIDDMVFVGDLMIKNFRTVYKLPTGNKYEIRKSLEDFEIRFKGQNIIIYPGHGSTFLFDKVNISDFYD